MKKSKEVTKYEPQWQVIRSIVKGSFNNDLEYKFSLVYDYFKETNSYDRWERVYNWTEGLLRGFKDDFNRMFLAEKLDFLNELKPDKNYIITEVNYDILNNYSDEVKIKLYKDLVKRSSDWLKEGYANKELNDFINILLLYIKDQDKIIKDINKIEKFREEAKLIKNTYKFIYS